MEEILSTVFLIMFGCFFVLVILYLYNANRLFSLMEQYDYKLYQELGEPKVNITISTSVSNHRVQGSDANLWKVIFFILKKGYEKSNSIEVVEKSKLVRALIIINLVLFIIMFPIPVFIGLNVQ